MRVYLIGKTEPRMWVQHNTEGAWGFPGKAQASNFEDREWAQSFDWRNSGQALIEFAGRLCYESFDLPNPDTAKNDKYIRNIINMGHESVLEHVSVTFYVEGVSRNMSHELIRHRHLSFSEISQRYVDMSDSKFITPPAIESAEVPNETDMYEEVVEELQSQGKSRKQAREAARAYLLAGTETKFVVTGNLRAWRDVLKKRWSKHADAEMQEFAGKVWSILINHYPDVFEDIHYGA